MERLPVDMKKRIASWLHGDEARCLAQSCTAMHSDLALTTLLPPLRIISTQNWHGDYVSGDLLRCGPQIPLLYGARRTHSVTLKCTWHDQGWGNRKGIVLVVGHDTAIPRNKWNMANGRVLYSSPNAPHYNNRLTISFTPSAKEEGNVLYHLWYAVGGGGGHELSIENLDVYATIFEDNITNSRSPINSMSRTYRALFSAGVFRELMEAVQNGTSLQTTFYPEMLQAVAQSLHARLVAQTNNSGDHDTTSLEEEPTMALFCQSKGIPMDQGSLVALEELALFLIEYRPSTLSSAEYMDTDTDDSSFVNEDQDSLFDSENDDGDNDLNNESSSSSINDNDNDDGLGLPNVDGVWKYQGSDAVAFTQNGADVRGIALQNYFGWNVVEGSITTLGGRITADFKLGRNVVDTVSGNIIANGTIIDWDNGTSWIFKTDSD